MKGPLGRLLAVIGAFELGNVAATLLILRSTELLERSRGASGATSMALLLYLAYNVSATLISVPAGQASDRISPGMVLASGILLCAVSYLLFAWAGPSVLLLGAGFVLAGIGKGCSETAEHAAVATLASPKVRGSGFGVLAAIQSFGNLAASGIAGAVWSLASPQAAFLYITTWMIVALGGLVLASRSTSGSL